MMSRMTDGVCDAVGGLLGVLVFCAVVPVLTLLLVVTGPWLLADHWERNRRNRG